MHCFTIDGCSPHEGLSSSHNVVLVPNASELQKMLDADATKGNVMGDVTGFGTGPLCIS